jgi:hypothetical protein
MLRFTSRDSGTWLCEGASPDSCESNPSGNGTRPGTRAGLAGHDRFSHHSCDAPSLALGQAATVQDSPRAAPYEIRVRGHLGEMLIGAFPGLQVHAESGVTVLKGYVPDQAALYGVLAELEDLGLELLEVRAIDVDRPDGE